MNNSIYEPPQSELSQRNATASGQIYTPNQILLGSFWGGPIAAVYFLRHNYLALGSTEFAHKTLVAGIAFIVSLLGIMPFLPDSFPNMAIPVAYSLAAKHLAATTQLDKEQIEARGDHSRHSNWRVFAIGTCTLLAFFIAAIAFMFGLDSMGLINLD